MITSKKLEGATRFVKLEDLNTGVFKEAPEYRVGVSCRNELFESILSSRSFGFTHKKTISKPKNDLGIRLGK